MVVRKSRAVLLACSALFMFSGLEAALAQSATTEAQKKDEAAKSDDKGGTYLSPIVLKGGKKGNDPYAKTSASSAVSADEIEQFGGKNLDDVLRATPGTFTRDNPQNPGVAVNIRGLEGSGRVNMMVDGVRQNFRFTGHEAQGFTYVDSAFLGGVDINRGYVAGVGGGNALAGSVNFKTYNVEDLIKDGKNYGGFATATYGTNQAGWSEALLGAYRFNDDFAVLGGISKRDPGNYENGEGQKVNYTESDLISGLMKLEFTPDKDNSLKVTGNLLNDEFMANSYYQEIQSRIFSINYAYTPDDPLIDFRVNAYRSTLDMSYTFSPLITGGGAAAGRNIKDTGTGFDVSNTSNFDLGQVAVSSNYGFEYFHDNYDVLNSTAVPDRGVNGSGESTNYSAFSSTKFTYGIADLTAGLRYDHFALKGSGSVAAGNPLGLPAGAYNVDRSDGRVNPSVTLAINPVDWLQPYVTYAETSRGPTINETFVGGTHPGSGVRQSFYPNPLLDPEISKGWELGANVKFDDVIDSGDSLRIKADYFNNRIEDYITAAFTPTGGAYFINNRGTSKVQGVELQAAYDAGGYFASASYTHTDSDLPSQTNGFGAQSYLPEDIFSGTVGARFLEDNRLTVGARFYVVSNSYIGEVNVSPGQSPYEPGYSLVDMFANYKFEKGLELSANVSNVFNKSYTPALSSPAGGSTVDTGRGRTVMFTVKATF